jgi:hypothetical protein
VTVDAQDAFGRARITLSLVLGSFLAFNHPLVMLDASFITVWWHRIQSRNPMTEFYGDVLSLEYVPWFLNTTYDNDNNEDQDDERTERHY